VWPLWRPADASIAPLGSTDLLREARLSRPRLRLCGGAEAGHRRHLGAQARHVASSGRGSGKEAGSPKQADTGRTWPKSVKNTTNKPIGLDANRRPRRRLAKKPFLRDQFWGTIFAPNFSGLSLTTDGPKKRSFSLIHPSDELIITLDPDQLGSISIGIFLRRCARGAVFTPRLLNRAGFLFRYRSSEEANRLMKTILSAVDCL
jgi:hypothetical protein